jgi:hypothetical protein
VICGQYRGSGDVTAAVAPDYRHVATIYLRSASMHWFPAGTSVSSEAVIKSTCHDVCMCASGCTSVVTTALSVFL